jgi:TonB family protein
MFRSALCFAAGFAVCAQAALAAEPAVVLPASSKWQLDYGEQTCRLARAFGEGENLSIVFFTQHGPDDGFELTLAGEPLKRFAPNTVIQFGPAGGEWEIDPFKGDVEGVGPALIFSGIDLAEEPDEDEPEEAPTEAMDRLPAIDIERARGMEYIEVRQRKRLVRFDTGPLDAPFAALNACSEDLINEWGLNLDQHRSMTRMVDWTNSKQIVSRVVRDYPAAALRKGEQGIIRALLIVGADGKVERCTLDNATNSDALPAPACRALEDAVFEPALDSQSQPMRSFYITKIVYKMG